MKIKTALLALLLFAESVFSQNEQPLNLYGENFVLQVFIADEIERSLQKDSRITERGLESVFKLRLRRNGVPYVGELSNAVALLGISINGVDLTYADGDKMGGKAFSFNLEFYTYLYDQEENSVWATTYTLRNIGFAPDDELEDWLVSLIYPALDQFSIDFLEQNNL